MQTVLAKSFVLIISQIHSASSHESCIAALIVNMTKPFLDHLHLV